VSNLAQVLGMWQAQQPEQTTVIQRARSDANAQQQQQQQQQAAAATAASAPPAVSTAISSGFAAYSQQRETASPSPQARFLWPDFRALNLEPQSTQKVNLVVQVASRSRSFLFRVARHLERWLQALAAGMTKTASGSLVRGVTVQSGAYGLPGHPVKVRHIPSNGPVGKGPQTPLPLLTAVASFPPYKGSASLSEETAA